MLGINAWTKSPEPGAVSVFDLECARCLGLALLGEVKCGSRGGISLSSLQDPRRDEARMRLLPYLTEHPDAASRQIAVDLRVSNVAAYYCVKALHDKGLVKVRRFTNFENKAKIPICPYDRWRLAKFLPDAKFS